MEPSGRTLTVPASTTIISVEHPLIVDDLDAGVNSLGGEQQLSQVVDNDNGDITLGVSLRAGSLFGKKLAADCIRTRNVLVKVMVPKQAGSNKRKREDGLQPHNISASDLLQRLRDSKGGYRTEIVGTVNRTYRLGAPPDMQFSTSNDPFERRVRDVAAAPSYDKLKDFAIDHSATDAGESAFTAPPHFLEPRQPFAYRYQQADNVVVESDERGRVQSRNLQAYQKRNPHQITPDDQTMPIAPPANMPPLTSKTLLKALADIKSALEDRPILTKHYISSLHPTYTSSTIRSVLAYVAFSMKAGPWRDTYIKYGVDPRSDAKYRFYQTVSFQHMDERLKTKDDGPNKHVFDGRALPAASKIWQLCDLHDPLLQRVINTEDIRGDCDVHAWGWYHNNTIPKVRVIMRDHVRTLLADEAIPRETYEAVAAYPDRLGPYAEGEQATFPTGKLGELSTEMRTLARRSGAAKGFEDGTGENNDDDEDGGDDEDQVAIDDEDA